MAIQAGNDFEDLGINGDTTSADALLSAFDGWLKLAKNSSETNQIFFSGSGLTKSIFSQMLKNLPTKYQSRRNDLRFFVPVNLTQDYIDTLSDRETALGDELIAEGARALAYGIPVIAVPLMPATLAGTYGGASGNHGTIVFESFQDTIDKPGFQTPCCQMRMLRQKRKRANCKSSIGGRRNVKFDLRMRVRRSIGGLGDKATSPYQTPLCDKAEGRQSVHYALRVWLR